MLAARAARSGRSLHEYLRRHLIASAAKLDIETLFARIEARKKATHTVLSRDTIFAHRDADRR